MLLLLQIIFLVCCKIRMVHCSYATLGSVAAQGNANKFSFLLSVVALSLVVHLQSPQNLFELGKIMKYTLIIASISSMIISQIKSAGLFI